MAKYLVKANYTAPDGVKGLISGGGTSRVNAVADLLTSLGGKLESFYFAFGEVDAYVICDLPDSVSGTAASLTVNASGLATCSVVPLITPEEVDAAVKKTARYTPPGSSA